MKVFVTSSTKDSDKFPLCVKCKHLNKDKSKSCTAFPEGIPKDILTGKVSHINNVEGDGGIKYEPL